MTPGVDVGTEQTNVSPWCVDDVDALTLAVSLPHTVLGAISAAHHGRAIFAVRSWRRGKKELAM
jgi:hypothetical protein